MPSADTKAPWQEPLADDLKRLGMKGTARDVEHGRVSKGEALARVSQQMKPGRRSEGWLQRAQNIIDGYQADGLGGDRG